MIPTLLLEFDIWSEQPIKFNGFSGVALRGSLFQALDILYTGNDPSFNNRYQTDPILHLLMRNGGIETITKNTVSPFVIRPSLNDDSKNLTFGISLFGHARKLASHIISAVEAMGVIGLGIERTKFEVHHIRQKFELDNTSKHSQDELDNSWESLVEFSARTSITSIALNFLTPTTIIDSKELCLVPEFKSWFHRLLERILQLKQLTQNNNLWIPVEELLTIAETIAIEEDNTFQFGRVKSKRYSRKIVGFQGCVHYEGEVAPLLPYIMVGESVHVGKNTVKGCGRYIIENLD
ncbi:MAG: CRISPR system precrRNA processing endoribonuclease RAMP protein Cas6 [Chloroflexota bacterium]